MGDPAGQFDWGAQDLGGYHAANFDVAIVDPSAVWGTELGTRALRVSNGVTSNGFGNQLQSPSLADEAGETEAVTSSLSGGNRQSRLTGTITFASATKTYQPGLVFGFFPDRGDGARMANFRISDQPDGLQLDVSVVDLAADSFVYHTIASGLSRDEVHTLTFTLDFVDGPNNDVMVIKVGNDVCTTFSESGSWEEYHRQWAGNDPPVTFPVDSMMFRVYSPSVPANLGGGILFDRFDISSSTVPAALPAGVAGAPSAPVVSVTGSQVSVTAAPPATNPCQPVTGYEATLTPRGGGLALKFASKVPTFTIPDVPEGDYDVTVAATNAAGTSAASGAAPAVVSAAEPSPGPSPDPTGSPVSPSGDGELAETGPTLEPGMLAVLAIASAGLMVAGVALSRTGIRRRS